MGIVFINDETLKGIAEQIREKLGVSDKYKPNDMPSAVQSVYDKGLEDGISVAPTPPTLKATFGDNTWEEIIWACQNNAVPETWSVGDEKTMTIDGNDAVIAICGKNHDEYADGGIAPLTFIQKTAFMSAPMHSEHFADSTFVDLRHTPYTETDMYKTTLPSVIEMMPDGIKENLRAVKKKNAYAPPFIITRKNAFFETADKIWLFSEAEIGGGWNNWSDGERYNYAFGHCVDANDVETTIMFFLRSYSSTDYFITYMTDPFSGVGGPIDDLQTLAKPLIFGFCF